VLLFTSGGLGHVSSGLGLKNLVLFTSLICTSRLSRGLWKEWFLLCLQCRVELCKPLHWRPVS